MPPNLLFKSGLERGGDSKKNVIKTDFILENVFSYLLRNRHDFDAVSAINKKEDDIWLFLKETLNAFRESYASHVRNLCSEIGVLNESTIESALLGVSNELFAEGITWSRIIAFFVFVGELSLMCISKKLPDSILDQIYESFSTLVKEKLESWIDDHGGWEGITSLSVVTQQETLLTMPNPSWAKSFLHGTVRVIGTLASIVNTPNNII